VRDLEHARMGWTRLGFTLTRAAAIWAGTPLLHHVRA